MPYKFRKNGVKLFSNTWNTKRNIGRISKNNQSSFALKIRPCLHGLIGIACKVFFRETYKNLLNNFFTPFFFAFLSSTALIQAVFFTVR